MADWALKNKIKKVMTLVTDYGPGIDAEKSFTGKFTAGGGTAEALRVPLRNPILPPSSSVWLMRNQTPCSFSCPQARVPSS